MALSGASSSKQLKFGGEFEFDFSAYQLRQSGSVLKLERIPTELLLMLIERRGQLVTRDQIVERVWGKDVFLDTDNSINAAIRKIRQVLKDDPEQPRFVQTLTGRGYRFIAQVEESGPQANAGSGPDQPTSPSDNLLGKKVSHYRILQLLGGGGMGVVYMAEDLKLGRRVALKFLPAEVGSDPKVFERFEREARAASSLDHPNICSIYQLGEHEGRPFIVMQMLEGRTLREWIECASQRDRQSNLGEMLDLARQITDGLEAAHKKGIVHRDIKPANIFVTTSGRAKILDFGVAKITETFEVCEPKAGGNAVPGDAAGTVADPSLTRTEGSLGTPSYVSPEQIRREKVDARSDLYSFGLVLYEMATGKRAFAGNTVTAIRDAVLRSPVTPPRQVSPAIPVDLERIIQKSLEKDPDQRYQSASDLRTDLLGVSTGVRSRPSVKTVGLGIAAGAVLVAAILFAMNTGGVRSRLFRPPETSGTGQVRTRPSVAVIGFKNLSGKQEEGWISTALAEMLSTELAAGQQLRVIPGENVTRMKLDLVLPPSDSYAGDTLARIRNHLNSDLIVVGSYLALGKDSGGKVRLDLQLQDARAGETITSVTTDGTESDLTDLVSRSGATLRQKLGVADITTQDQSRVSSSFPTNPDAARFYAEGLSKLQTFDAFGARELLQKAVGIDPNHALTHSALAQCWSLLGYDAKSREEAKIAVDLSANLLREDQLSIEARYYETSHEWQKAIEIYRMLWGVFPDSLEYGLRLARAQASAGAGKDAIGTVEKLSKLPPPAGADPRIDLAESLAADQIGDLRREEAAAARAAEKGRRLEARIIIASALLARGSALIALGDNTNAATVQRSCHATRSCWFGLCRPSYPL